MYRCVLYSFFKTTKQTKYFCTRKDFHAVHLSHSRILKMQAAVGHPCRKVRMLNSVLQKHTQINFLHFRMAGYVKRISRKAKNNVLIIQLGLLKYLSSQSIPKSIPRAMATSAKKLLPRFHQTSWNLYFRKQHYTSLEICHSESVGWQYVCGG